MPSRTTRSIALALVGLACLHPVSTGAQDSVTPDSLNARITALEASGESPEALATLRASAEAYSQSQHLKEAAETFQNRIDLIPGQLAQRQASLSATPPPVPVAAELAARSLEELDSNLAETRTSLGQARSNQQEIETEIQQRALKTKALPTTNTNLADSLEILSNTIAASPPLSDNLSTADIATQTNLLARQSLLQQTIKTNQRELDFINAAAEIAAIDRSLAEREVKRLTSTLEIIQQVGDSKRRMQADSQAAQARSEADLSTDIAAVAALAEENAKLAALRAGDAGLTAQLHKANSSLADVTSQLDLISEYYHSAQRRVELVTQAGFSLGETTGELLRSERRGLPDVDELRDLTRADLNANTTAGLELIKLEKQRRDHLLNSENTIAQIVAPLPPGDEKGRTEAAEAARRLLDSRLDLLDQLVTEYRTLTSTVSQTNRKRQTLILRTQAYAQLIDERVLWFRSAPVIGVEAIKDGIKSIVTIISPDRWTAFFQTLSNDFNSNWALWVAALLVIGLLLARRPAHKRQLEAASEIASKRTSLTYLPTAKALTYTILLSLPAPLALGFMAFRHGGIDGGGIATGLHEIAGQLLVFGFLRRVCYTDGLAVAHFRMLPHHARVLHVTITKFLWLVLPAAFALGVLDSSDGHPGARLISITIMLVFVALVLGLLKPSRKLVGTPVLQATAVCFGVVVPLVFVAAAAAGYFYTVRELQWRLEASLTLVLFLLLVSAMVQRWFLVARRSLAVAQAEQQHRASAESDSAPPESVALTQKEIESATVDITKIKDQTRQLLRSALAMALAVGLWGIWSNVLPALNILDEIHLWPDTTELATEQGTTTPQPPSPSPSPLQLPSAPTSDSTTSPPDAPASQPVSADFIALDGLATKTVDPNFGWVTLADVALLPARIHPHLHRRQKHPRPTRYLDPQPARFETRRQLRRHRFRTLPHRPRRRHPRLRPDRRHVVKSPVDRRRGDRRHRLRPAGGLRQFRRRPDPPLRTPHPPRRLRHHRHHLWPGHPHRDPRHDHQRFL